MMTSASDVPTTSLNSLHDLSLNPFASPSERERELQFILDTKEKQVQLAGALGQRVLAQQIELEEKIRHIEYIDAQRSNGKDLDAEASERYRELKVTIKARDLEISQLSSSLLSKSPAENVATTPTVVDLSYGKQGPSGASVSSSAMSRRAKNAAHRADDIEFAFEIGSGLLGEVRRLQSLLGERDKVVQDMKEEMDDLVKSNESLRSALRSQEQMSDKLKAENRKHEVTLQELRCQLSDSQTTIEKLESEHKQLAEPLVITREALDRCKNEAEQSPVNLGKTVEELLNQLSKFRDAANRERDNLNETIESLHAHLCTRDDVSDVRTSLTRFLFSASAASKIVDPEKSIQGLRDQLASIQHTAGMREKSLVGILSAHGRKLQCETLYAHGRTSEAAESLSEMMNTLGEDVRDNEFMIAWIAGFAEQCTSRLHIIGNEEALSGKYDEALAAYSTALSLTSLTPSTILTEWARLMLSRCSAYEALVAATKFKLPRFHVYREICNVLEEKDGVTEVIGCFRRLQKELQDEMNTRNEQMQWELSFRRRYVQKLGNLGDIAIESKDYDAAVEYYTNALLLDPTNMIDILVKRSKARAAIGSLEEALLDAEKVAELDSSSYKGFESKYAVLHEMGRHKEAFNTFEIMLSHLDQSTDPHDHEIRRKYMNPTPLIRGVVEQVIHDIPRVLIDISTGRLYDRALQAAAFEELSTYDEMRSAMTTRDKLDYPRIRREVRAFYRYVMFSHRWQPNEPTFQMVENGTVYGLPASPTAQKLVRFCELVQFFSFRWAWSDTCCVNQADKGVQQESVVAMFRWYHGSSLTIVHLLGVFSGSQEFGCLWRSIWNTRGWTYQEYVASKIVQFYTEDWKPYLNLDMFNHKESRLILSEMERATNVATRELATLQPGLDRAREKLYLASNRQTTREEDISYSLFGIFDVSIPVIYGEGKHAIRRLLEHILTRSDDVTLLSWNGKSGSISYLPADLTVYNQIIPPHIPRPVEAAEMDDMITILRSSQRDFSLTVPLYERFHDLSPLLLVAGRLRLPCMAFPITNLVPLSTPDSEPDLAIPVFRAASPILGDVEIKTADDLSEMEGLLLIHPWISPILDQDFSRGAPQFDLATRASRLLVRLRQPFGALLIASLGRVQYRRVATDTLIMVQVREQTTLKDLMDSIRTVDIQ